MSKDKLYAIAIALAIASLVLSVLFKGVFVFLLIPALLAWNGSRDKSG